MNKDWSEKNKEIQKLLSKEATFKEAVQKLIEFRKDMFQQISHQNSCVFHLAYIPDRRYRGS